MRLKIVKGPIIEYIGNQIYRVGAVIHMDWWYQDKSPFSTDFHVWLDADEATDASGAFLPPSALLGKTRQKVAAYVAEHYPAPPEKLSVVDQTPTKTEVQDLWKDLPI